MPGERRGMANNDVAAPLPAVFGRHPGRHVQSCPGRGFLPDLYRRSRHFRDGAGLFDRQMDDGRALWGALRILRLRDLRSHQPGDDTWLANDQYRGGYLLGLAAQRDGGNSGFCVDPLFSSRLVMPLLSDFLTAPDNSSPMNTTSTSALSALLPAMPLLSTAQ